MITPSTPPSTYQSTPTHCVLFTADPDLQESILRLAAAADIDISVFERVASAPGSYGIAPLVILGTDAVPDVLTTPPARRAHVLIVGRDVDPDVWRAAVTIGAEAVLVLPDAERDLIERLIDGLHAQPHDAPVVSILRGCGGAGASTLAAAVARTAAARCNGDVLLIDADPLGGGLDVLLEAESLPGLRWPDLAQTSGRVSPDAVRHGLPVVDGVHLLSHTRRSIDVPPAAWEALLAAGARGFALTVVDGRHPLAVPHSQLAVIVVPADIRSLAAAAALVSDLQGNATDVRVIVRHRRDSDLDPDDVMATLELPVIGSWSDARPASQERVCTEVLAALGLGEPRRSRRRVA
jgi:secretion/DNA translocation related CpaE-like protein